jgi:hypothetical protein
MKKILPVSLMLAAMCYCAVAQAQNQTPDQNPPQLPAQPQVQVQPQAQAQTPPAPTQTAANSGPLDDRFTACLNNKDCSIQARLQIIQEEDDAMNNNFQKIHQTCADANFNDCLDKEKNDVQAWYNAQDNMRAMMSAMGAQDLNAKQPAAGEPSPCTDNGTQKTFWQKIWPFGKNNTTDTSCNNSH